MEIYEKVLEMMRLFLDGSLAAEQFTEQFADLWRVIRDQQYEAINRQDDVQEALRQLNRDILAGTISPEDYEQLTHEQFEKVKDAWVQPGSPTDKVLSHVFVEADAYEADPEFREPYQIDADALREVVREALKDLATTGDE